MPKVVGIRFKKACKIYYFDPGDLDLEQDDYVIVETSRGQEAGYVAIEPKEVPEEEIVGHLKKVIRVATTEDLLTRQRYKMQEDAALERCQEKVAQYNLPMKVVGAEYSFDGSSLVFFFTADKRVDFRELVRDLARTFRTRIELRQIGVRDEAKLIGGVGPCGRQLCCITHLTDFKPVSIRMAKQQDLPLSPMEISGLCGRLLCCLTYENEYYKEAKRQMPRVGKMIDTDYGRGRVLGVNVVKQTVQVGLNNEMTVEIPWEIRGPEDAESKESEKANSRHRDQKRKKN
jgi:cell fate regulator YaaT (PSP1 superfamily)